MDNLCDFNFFNAGVKKGGAFFCFFVVRFVVLPSDHCRLARIGQTWSGNDDAIVFEARERSKEMGVNVYQGYQVGVPHIDSHVGAVSHHGKRIDKERIGFEGDDGLTTVFFEMDGIGTLVPEQIEVANLILIDSDFGTVCHHG
jgi:hypothetical protein